MLQKTTIASLLVLAGAALTALAFSPPISSPSKAMSSNARTSNVATRLEFPLTAPALYQTSSDEREKPKELTPETVAEMVECCFVNACLQLAQGYVDVLKLFIVAAKASYELGMDPVDLIRRVENIRPQSAGRDLMPEEVKLRNTWIRVVYLVLQYLQHTQKVETSTAADIDEAVQSTFSTDLLADMKKQHDAGGAFHLEQWLDKYEFPNMDDPMQKAIISQSLRVIWFTYTVLNEERVCNEEKTGLKAQPPIPGAFD
jgi:hypothetical protein